MDLIRVLENQYRLHKSTEEEQAKIQFEWIDGHFTTVQEEPCGWLVLKFHPNEVNKTHDHEWSNYEQFITDTGQILMRIAEWEFQVKNFSDCKRIKPIIQDDYTSARYKSSILEFKDDIDRFWQNKMLVTPGKYDQEINIEDNTRVPRFRIQSINIIRGVPGSGKSTFCKQLCQKHANQKILYTAPNHQQVCNFANKLVKDNIAFTVLSEESRLEKSLRKYHNSNQSDFNEKIKNQILPSSRVTLSTSTKPIKNLRAAEITILIIDEATRVTLIDAITLIRKMPDLKSIILCGDNKQLGARMGEHKVLDIFRYAKNQNVQKYFLPWQFRFGHGTNSIVSRIFYKGKMKNKRFDPESQIHFIIIKDCLCEDQIGCIREVEAVQKAMTAFRDDDNVAVITPYVNQIAKLNAIRELKDRVISIDRCQGAEYEHTIISVARHKGMGFIDRARLNVALTRARKSTIVVVNKNILAASPELSMIYNEAVEKGLTMEVVYGPTRYQWLGDNEKSLNQVQNGEYVVLDGHLE